MPSTGRNRFRLVYGYYVDRKSVSVSLGTIQFIWVRCWQLLFLKMDAFCYKSFCASSAPRWFELHYARKYLVSDEEIPTRKLGRGVFWTKGCLANNTRVMFWADVPTSHCVHFVTKIGRLGSVLSWERPAVHFMTQRIELLGSTLLM